MTRKKEKTGIWQNKIKAWDEVNEALRRMGELDIAMQKITGDLTLAINSQKACAEEELSPLAEERKELEASIALFCDDHKEEFTKTRSRELTFGLVAYRVVTRIAVRSKEACLAAMHALKLTQYIRTYEEPDKEALVDLDDAVLAKIGAKRKTEDKLRIEPAIEKVREAA